MKSIDIFDLKKFTYIPSPRVCDAIAEAAIVCLNDQKQKNGVELKIEKDITGTLKLQFDTPTQQSKDNWKDLEEATEYGATCIAIWVILKYTSYQVVQRSPKKTGFDYWLDFKKSDYPFQNRARLEISGILKGTLGQLNQRLREKINQTKRYETNNLPTYVIVVKFDKPIAKTHHYE